MATGRIGTNTVLTTRWSKAPAGGTTSLSGLDDNSVSLVYSVGYEQVYRNGVLLSRGNDYTATDGTTITLIDATITGDVIEVFANATIPLTDTYSQTVANGKFINNTLTTTTGDIIYASAANTPARLGIGSTDQVLKVSGGVPVWGAAGAAAESFTLLNSGNTSLSGTATKTITGISNIQELLIVVDFAATAGNGSDLLVRLNSDSTSKYGNYAIVLQNTSTYSSGNTIDRSSGPDLTAFTLSRQGNTNSDIFEGGIRLSGCNSTGVKVGTLVGAGGGTTGKSRLATCFYTGTSVISSVSIISSSGNFSQGDVRIYGA